MIDINELRRLAQAASHPTTKGRWVRLFGERTVYDRMEDGCRGIPVVSTDTHPPSPSEAACLDFIAAANPAVINELLDRLEAAEKDIALKERIIDSLRSALSTVANECNTPYSFDPTDNGTICVRCLKEKMKALLQLIQQPLSKVRTLSPEQIERHKLTAGECPSGSEVLLVSSVRRLLGCGIGDEKP